MRIKKQMFIAMESYYTKIFVKWGMIMNKLRIAVIFGGCSPEHDISLKSAHNVIVHMDRTKYEVVTIGITRMGEWLQYFGEPAHIATDTWHEADCAPFIISPCRIKQELKVDAAFPILHGKNGEDGTIQGLLEMANIPIIGCGILASALCMDKNVSHKLVKLAGVKVPRSVVDNHNRAADMDLSYHYPLFVKPARAGSSFGITLVESKDDLPHAIGLASKFDRKVIIEEAVEGFEVGCAIIGNGDSDDLIIGEVDEIELTRDFFCHHEKYTLETSAIHVPARIPPHKSEEIKATAINIYKALGCSGFARVDMFLTPQGDIVFNEVNAIPGLTAGSRFPNMLKAAGMTFEEIINAIIETAIIDTATIETGVRT